MPLCPSPRLPPRIPTSSPKTIHEGLQGHRVSKWQAIGNAPGWVGFVIRCTAIKAVRRPVNLLELASDFSLPGEGVQGECGVDVPTLIADGIVHLGDTLEL